MRSVDDKIVLMVSKKPLTFSEIEDGLRISPHDLIKATNRLRKHDRVKHIGRGLMTTYFSRESQRKTADIKSMGKLALDIYKIVKKYGPKRTDEIDEMLGVKYGSSRCSLQNLVAGGYMKSAQSDFKRGGYIYYVGEMSEEDLRLKTIGWREEQAYKIVAASKEPISAKSLGESMGIDKGHALGTGNNLVKRGMIFKSGPRKTKDGGEKASPREAFFYADPEQESLATIMSISPMYGVRIYSKLTADPVDTIRLSKKLGLSRNATYQVLWNFAGHGLIGSRKSGPGTVYATLWYLKKDSPRI